ncbi:cold-inducible protein YdjO-related protein [Jeotgalibacillus haloalkalitolerans]|uniref:Cold-inducible protein YdjO-related protein n=1 Tax=Jeotgalibacillus haloalkalitolerans TaxID=3104292 RepID=A0ABU5KM99_9BACL|nr:cold-inducible protein YdjO-related protein [Jeotgalibacillus sp. HH7-29]MDZ5711871.1 cold-inducible protein YdjO-related protein [Jeotgalibacillus sp. HH7-29]
MFQRKPTEEIQKEQTDVWECSADGCNVWMRDNFSVKGQEKQECPICGSDMVKGSRNIEVVPNPQNF